MAAYVYDIECFESMFTVIFLPATNAINEHLDNYEVADRANDDIAKNIHKEEAGTKTFVITHDLKRDDGIALCHFLINEKPTLYGYNNHGYDDLLLNSILINIGSEKYYKYKDYKGNILGPTAFLRALSDTIIGSYENNFKYSDDSILKQLANYNKPYFSIDLQTLNYITNISLKFIGILLKHYRIQDLPYHNITIGRYEVFNFDGVDIIKRILDYNMNDVLITKKLLHFSKKELIIRIETGKKYDVNVLSDSRSSMANKLIAIFYKDITGKYPNKHKQTIRSVVPFEPLIEKVIHFDTPQFNNFLKLLRGTVLRVGYDKFKPSLIHKGIKYQFGVGGLHTADKGMSIETDGTYTLIDVDANSYYPFTILNYKVHPAHIPDIHYLPMLHKIVYERIEAKMKAKDKSDSNWKDYKSKADILKIVVNIIYGKLGAVMHWLLDFAAMYKVTLNCQLGLIMLVEDFSMADFEVISANTDGVVCKVPNDRRDEYFKICEAWAKELNYGVEYTEYSKYYATNVNNYLAIKTDGEVKAKGSFVKDKSGLHDFLTKGYDMPIVAMAVYDYFVHDIPVKTTIRKHTDIYDFCKAQRIGRNYSPYKITIENGEIKYTLLQSTIRYIVTTNGYSIVKINPDATKKMKDGTTVTMTREISLLANRRLTLFNDYVKHDDFSDYKLDYGYYISESNKLINNIKGLITKNLKKSTGTLFD